MPTLPGAAVGIVLAAAGYPEAPRVGDAIDGLHGARATGALLFHAGTARDSVGGYETAGGRVLTVVGRGADIAQARTQAESAAERDLVRRAPAPARHRSRRRCSPRWRSPGQRPVIRRYTLPEMAAIWSEQARFEQILRVELAVARAQAARGLIPAAALEALETRATVDVERIAEIERTTDHDIIAFVSQVAQSVGPEGRYLHFGLTSSDVVDTGLALQLRAAGARLLEDTDRLIEVLVARARAEADTTMMGRTHSVHAEPTTFGLKVASWAFEIDRGRTRLADGGRRDRDGQDLGPGRDLQPPRPGHRGRGARRAGTARRPGEHADRAARPPRGAARRDRDPRRQPGADRDRDPQPAAHGDRRGPGAVQGRAEGLERDAPQAQPDPVRADLRGWPGCCAGMPPRRSRTSHCGTNGISAIRARSA